MRWGRNNQLLALRGDGLCQQEELQAGRPAELGDLSAPAVERKKGGAVWAQLRIAMNGSALSLHGPTSSMPIVSHEDGWTWHLHPCYRRRFAEGGGANFRVVTRECVPALPVRPQHSWCAGVEALPRVLRAATAVDPRATILCVDGAYDHMSRQAMLAAIACPPRARRAGTGVKRRAFRFGCFFFGTYTTPAKTVRYTHNYGKPARNFLQGSARPLGLIPKATLHPRAGALAGRPGMRAALQFRARCFASTKAAPDFNRAACRLPASQPRLGPGSQPSAGNVLPGLQLVC